ncbi:hypothetical protein RHMOL_Rhmol10G0127600 [Rhododendron molle]|uniref:Uncharacterized protein n=1 Tax=Rhododendron molle TaxID=49168 RepID=A0ACC0M2Q4_RHOML|nr:hypothetical protein RHMOL_Rhmol10G0127600 [Rhododendron molle]
MPPYHKHSNLRLIRPTSVLHPHGGPQTGPGPGPPVAWLPRAQPLLAVKFKLEQLIISFLDDPSVSRVC